MPELLNLFSSCPVRPAYMYLRLKPLGHLNSVEKLVPRGRLFIRPLQFFLRHQWAQETDSHTTLITMSDMAHQSLAVRETSFCWMQSSRVGILCTGLPHPGEHHAGRTSSFCPTSSQRSGGRYNRQLVGPQLPSSAGPELRLYNLSSPALFCPGGMPLQGSSRLITAVSTPRALSPADNAHPGAFRGPLSSTTLQQ